MLKVVFGGQSLLLTGDIEKSVENKLVLSGFDIDSDFLKIAHHGSKTSTTDDFLNSVTPKVAFIQVGASNRYGHPSLEVTERLEKKLIPYYRTDIDGVIELIIGNGNYFIK